MSDEKSKKVDVKPDKTVLKSLALGGLLGGGGEVCVDVKNGKAVRIRPFKYDWKYDRKTLNPWKIKRNGKTLEPLMKSLPGPSRWPIRSGPFPQPDQVSADPRRLGSQWRAQPAEPRQEQVPPRFLGRSYHHHRQRNQASSRRSTGPLAILVQGDGHGECKTIHTPHGHQARLLDMMGGFTQQVRQPDSWEGWYWGSKHVWGQGFQGMMSPAANVVKDIIGAH